MQPPSISRPGPAIPAPIAGRPELARPPRVSMKRVVAWSMLGSCAAILVALAARPDPMEDVDARVDAVIAIYAQGDRAGARAAADELVRSDPSEPRAWLLLGMLEEDRKAVPEAEQAYRVALGLMDAADASRIDVLVTLADLRRRKGDPAGALDEIDKLAREHGVSGRVRHARVLSLCDLRRFEEALSETRLIAEEKFGGGVAQKLEKQIRSLMDAEAKRGG